MKLVGLCLFLLNTLSAGMYKPTDELIRVGLGSLNGSSRFQVYYACFIMGVRPLLQLLIQNFLIGSLERRNEGGGECCDTEHRKENSEDSNTINKLSMLFRHCTCT
jgi:hypothetical protein